VTKKKNGKPTTQTLKPIPRKNNKRKVEDIQEDPNQSENDTVSHESITKVVTKKTNGKPATQNEKNATPKANNTKTTNQTKKPIPNNQNKKRRLNSKGAN
jgi:hypothetical protein